MSLKYGSNGKFLPSHGVFIRKDRKIKPARAQLIFKTREEGVSSNVCQFFDTHYLTHTLTLAALHFFQAQFLAFANRIQSRAAEHIAVDNHDA